MASIFRRGFLSFVQVKCFWGHTARVWDVHFASEDEKLQSRALGDSYTLVSVSEDRTCRTWDRFGLVDVRRGHTGTLLACISYSLFVSYWRPGLAVYLFLHFTGIMA